MAQGLFKISEIQLSYHPKVKAADRPKIKGIDDVYQLFLQNWSKDRIEVIEEFKMILLDRKNAVLGISHISTGGFSGVLADPKVVFAIALRGAASGILLAHNHPSGSLKPGADDLRITESLKRSAWLLGLKIVDHLIISPDGYFSFSEHQLL